MEPEDVLVPVGPERSREVEPMSKCWVKLAPVELEPGFVVPKAQMMSWVPRVPLTGMVKANFGVEPVTCAIRIANEPTPDTR